MTPARWYERLTRFLAAANPLELDRLVRLALVQYHFLCSDRTALRMEPAGPIDLVTPTSFKGQGRIAVHPSATFGVVRSPGNLACSYVEARTPRSAIEIGAECVFNNRLTLISENARIVIGARCLVGHEVFIGDSNFHDLAVDRRRQVDPEPMEVRIGEDVFIGARATILKGADIGAGSVIAAGAVVMPRMVVPPRSVVAGNPARVISSLDSEG